MWTLGHRPPVSAKSVSQKGSPKTKMTHLVYIPIAFLTVSSSHDADESGSEIEVKDDKPDQPDLARCTGDFAHRVW